MPIRTLAALVLLTSVQAVAASTKILLPVVIATPVPGALGSLWSSEVDLYSSGGSLRGVFVAGTAICHFDPCTGEGIVDKSTYENVPVPMAPGAVGKFLSVFPEEALSDLTISLRVFDESRSVTNRGTTIPVIHESKAARSPVQLLGVAIAPPFRSMLRVYDFDPDDTHVARVSIYLPSSDHDLLLDTRVLALRKTGDAATYPGFAQLDLSYLADRAQKVRVEVAPVTEGLRFWAFVSTTNNQTQHITLETP